MNDELKEISSKLDKMRQEYTGDKYETLSYILCGFTLAMASHGWISRRSRKPKQCSKCHSPYWNQSGRG